MHCNKTNIMQLMFHNIMFWEMIIIIFGNYEPIDKKVAKAENLLL